MENSDNKDFEKAKLNEIKISLKTIEYSEGGATSELVEPDLRYSYDGKEFGLHISNYREKTLEEIIAEIEDLEGAEDLLSKLKVLYISKTQIKEFSDEGMPNLEFLNLSDNEFLTKIKINNSKNLEEIIAFGCNSLRSVSIQGSISELKKADFSYCDISDFKIDKAENLEFLNIQKNLIEELDIAGLENLKYLFADTNHINQFAIKWPEKFNQIEIIELDNNEYSNEALISIIENTDGDLKRELNNYLSAFHEEGLKEINRLKLIFLGNTTVGKTTLKRILTTENSQLKEEIQIIKKESESGSQSTHGVHVFTHTLQNNHNKDIEILGFDFGGQDYYHSTHLPFISHNALHILVYGAFKDESDNWVMTDSYKFDRKKADSIEEILYPINYWIGSLKPNNPKSIDLPEEKKRFNESDLEMVENLRKDDKKQELNLYDLRRNTPVNLGDVVSFNFWEDAFQVKKWLESKIKDYSKSWTILNKDYELISKLKNLDEVIYKPSDLFNNSEINSSDTNFETEDELISALKRIHSNNYGYYFECKKENEEVEDSFFIKDLSKFSEWIHQEILGKEAIKVDKGYLKEEKLNEINFGHPDDPKRVITFLEEKNIIFKVKDTNKWVAPSYLQRVKSKTEELLIESFDLPDVIFEFPGFFHSNIILMIINKFKKNLVKDESEKEYLMWKNKIILYQANENEKAFLLIELKFPEDKDYKGNLMNYDEDKEEYDLPRLVISRSYSGFVHNNIFGELFSFVKEELETFKPSIHIKTPYNDYIPYECLNQNNKDRTQGVSTRTSLIFHNKTFYSIHDFRHFLEVNTTKPTKIFIGYSRYDIEFVNEFLLHLKPYETRGDIVVFYDKDMKMGEKWDAELKHQLETSDIFVCLVSPHLLNTQYVLNLELPLAHEKGVKIAPVIVEDCNWKYENLGTSGNLLIENHVFEKAKVLSSSKSERNKEWNKIALELKSFGSRESKNKGSGKNSLGNEPNDLADPE